MTCIVGVVGNGKVVIGGDSAGSDSWNTVNRADRKVFNNGGFVFGFTTSFRMGQLLRYSFSPPRWHEDKDLMAFMVVDFVDSLRACLKAGGYATKNQEVETGGTFLVGFRDRLFKIEGDYQVGESGDGYDACGCGQIVALGALHATRRLSPRSRVRAAIAAAEAHASGGVRGPYHLLST